MAPESWHGKPVSFEDYAARWEKLRERYAPERRGVWSDGRAPRPVEGQGWKLHLSATIMTACELLERCGRYLVDSGLPFKIAAGLEEIRMLNSARRYGRSQIGKVVTVYCADPVRLRRLAKKLDELIGILPCPAVPSDRRYHPRSNVFYRYGAYASMKVRYQGRWLDAYRDPAGKLVPDRRTASSAVPDWTEDPFAKRGSRKAAVRKERYALAGAARYRAVSAIHWRGAGGVFRALDDSTDPPATLIMKEGLRHGDVSFDGFDGVKLVRNEARALRSLRDAGVMVPGVIDLFVQNRNAYLVQDLIAGENLADLVDKDKVAMNDAPLLGRQMCQIVSSIHAAGWVWRDCKLGNFICEGMRLWAIDLEFAMPVRGSPRSFRSTPGYFRERSDPITGEAAVLLDRYALGVGLHRLFGGASERSKEYARKKPALPAGLNQEIATLIFALQHKQPEKRPSAAEALLVLERHTKKPRKG